MLIITFLIFILRSKCCRENIEFINTLIPNYLENQDLTIINKKLLDKNSFSSVKVEKPSEPTPEITISSETAIQKYKTINLTSKHKIYEKQEILSKSLFIELTIDYILYKINDLDNEHFITDVLSFIWDKISQDRNELALLLSCILYNTVYLQKFAFSKNFFFTRGFLQPITSFSSATSQIFNLKDSFRLNDFFEIFLLDTSIFWKFLFKDCKKTWSSLNNSYRKEKWCDDFEKSSFEIFNAQIEDRFAIYHDFYNLFNKF